MPQVTNDGFTRISDTKYYLKVCDNGQVAFGKWSGYIQVGICKWSDYREKVRCNGMNSRYLLAVCKYLKPKIDKYVNISSDNNVKEYSEYIEVDESITNYGFINCRAEYIRENYNDYVEINDRGNQRSIKFTYHEFNEVVKALEEAVNMADSIRDKIKKEKEYIKSLYK